MVNPGKTPELESTEREPDGNGGDRWSFLQELAERSYEAYPIGHHLTGRTPERIEEEAGLKQEWLFPEGKKVLYIGDPWQKMDIKGVTIAEMEFGEVQSFVNSEGWLRSRLKSSYENTNYIIDGILQNKKLELSEDERNKLEEYRQRFEDVYQQTQGITDLDEYPEASTVWKNFRTRIETEAAKRQDEIEEKDKDVLLAVYRDGWHDAMFGERAFEDVHDWTTIISPKLERVRKDLGDFVDEEERERTLKKEEWDLIRAIRTRKKAEKADVVQATFPALPFNSNTFDRVVASWSSSRHLFEDLDRREFGGFWSEIDRVLREGGKAYIFPIKAREVDSPFSSREFDEQELLASLETFISKKPGAKYRFLDKQGKEVSSEVDNYPNWYTLLLEKA